MLRSLTTVTLLAGAATLARAEDKTPPPEHRWLGEAQAGLLISSGNANSRSANLKIDVARSDGPWKNIAHLAGFYGSSNGINSAQRIEGRWELDHDINDHLFATGSLDGNRDRFSGFNYQATASAGIGYKFIDTDATKLAATVGVGYQRLQTQTVVKDTDGRVVQRIDGPTQSDAVGTAGVNYEQKLSASTKLTDKLLATSGALNTAVANDLAVNVAVSEVLALSVGYGIRYNTAPADKVRKLDQLTTVNLVYNFK